MENKDCIFCKIIKGEIPVVKIWEDEDFLAFPDANPRGKGHSLIIPKKHFSTIMDISNEISRRYIDAIKKTAKILMEKYSTDSFNIVLNHGKAAGQKVEHVHVHILPRKEGDKKDLILFKDKYNKGSSSVK